MNGIFKQLLNVKGTVVEDVRITDSPLRPGPVLEIRVRPRRGMLRCSRCGRKRRGCDRGGGRRRWRHWDFGCWRVELVAGMPRADRPRCGVVVAMAPLCIASMFVGRVRQCFFRMDYFATMIYLTCGKLDLKAVTAA